MNSGESLTETLLCAKCGETITTNKTIGVPDSKKVRCPNCQQSFSLGSGRQVANRQVVEALPATKSQFERPVVGPPAISPIIDMPTTLAPSRGANQMARFMAEGQKPEVISRLLDQVNQICTSTEEILYMAVQEKPVVNIAPDAVVLTNRRFIIYRTGMLGQVKFVDCLWRDADVVHMQEDMIGATILFKGLNGHIERIEYLPRAQARMIYRIGQAQEEEMLELRRQRRMEEARNAANQVNINNVTGATVQQSDPVAKLQQIKQMLDGGLITAAEYELKKAEILASM